MLKTCLFCTFLIDLRHENPVLKIGKCLRYAFWQDTEPLQIRRVPHSYDSFEHEHCAENRDQSEKYAENKAPGVSDRWVKLMSLIDFFVSFFPVGLNDKSVGINTCRRTGVESEDIFPVLYLEIRDIIFR